MARPFRFGVQLMTLPRDTWREEVAQIEDMGFSSILWPDHFGHQLEPVAAAGAIAGATSRINIGALVFGVDYRHPVVYAKAAATLDMLSGGRLEFGIGAGWMESDYVQAGIPLDSPGVRIERLEEALQVIKAIWTERSVSFSGKHYALNQLMGSHESAQRPHPKILIGGGGPKMLALAGRHADIVGINPSLHQGMITPDTARDLASERLLQKIGWVRKAAADAGRDPDEIEYSSLAFVVSIIDDPSPVRQTIAASTGMSEEEIASCPLFITGPPAEVRERLAEQRERTGISYVLVQGMAKEMLERFGEEVVGPLAGT